MFFSCSQSKQEVPIAQKKGFLESLSDFDYEQDEKTGYNRPVSTRDTQPFSGKANAFSGDNSDLKKEFKTDQFENKRWQGSDKKKNLLPWKGSKKDYEYSPKFVKDNSSFAGKVANERNQSFANTPYKTSSASEQSGKRFSKVTDSVIQKRRESYVPPAIISNQTYNGSRGRSVEDVKQLLKWRSLEISYVT